LQHALFKWWDVHNDAPHLLPQTLPQKRPTSTFKAADGWDHNCIFGIDTTVTLAPNQRVVDAVWVTGGDEYGSCHGTPKWCGLHSWVGVSRDGGATFADTAWDDQYQVDQANPYRVAVHPFNGARAVVAARKGLPLTFTRDFGVTWANSTGEAVSVGFIGNFWFGQPLATEKQLRNTTEPERGESGGGEATVYYYNGTTTLFVSTDSGGSFAPVHTGFPSWATPYFGVATPPHGASAAGDVWVFAGWKLYHSTNGGANFSQAWSFYHPDKTITIGALPMVRSPSSGRDERQLAALCTAKQAAKALEEGLPALPVPAAPSAGYAVYVLGNQKYGDAAALYASVDFGHSWIALSGANATAEQGLGDYPSVIEASAKDVGVVYVGTGGRGLFGRNVTSTLAAALLACE
jgi:hypothetical protein